MCQAPYNFNLINNSYDLATIDINNINRFQFLQIILSYLLFPVCTLSEEDEDVCINKTCQKCYKKSLQADETISNLAVSYGIVPRLISYKKIFKHFLN